MSVAIFINSFSSLTLRGSGLVGSPTISPVAYIILEGEDVLAPSSRLKPLELSTRAAP